MRRGTIQMIRLAERLRDEVDKLAFGPPVAHVYNPLRYAWAAHRQYLAKYAEGRKRVIFLGMNPGPFGMAQTGNPVRRSRLRSRLAQDPVPRRQTTRGTSEAPCAGVRLPRGPK